MMTRKHKNPRCIYCHEKPARYGKEQGFAHNLYCSMKCAYSEAIESHVDSTFCDICGEWLMGACEGHDEVGAA
jgi:hypothetical protein